MLCSFNEASSLSKRTALVESFQLVLQSRLPWDMHSFCWSFYCINFLLIPLPCQGRLVWDPAHEFQKPASNRKGVYRHYKYCVSKASIAIFQQLISPQNCTEDAGEWLLASWHCDIWCHGCLVPTDRQVLHAVHVETIINIARNGCVNHPRLEVLGHKCLPHRFTLKVGGYGRANWQGAIHHLFSARREPTTTVYEVLQPFNFHLSPQRLLGVSAQSFRCMFWSVSVSGWFRMAGFELFWSLLVQVREGFRFRCFTGVHTRWRPIFLHLCWGYHLGLFFTSQQLHLVVYSWTSLLMNRRFIPVAHSSTVHQPCNFLCLLLLLAVRVVGPNLLQAWGYIC